MKSEPVITTATATAIVTALIALLVALGLPISDELQVAILGVVAALAPLAVILSRGKVVPSANVVESVKGTTVIAGEASELATGTPVREAGDLYDDYTDPEAETSHEQTHRADG
ncbi:hypothetical protein Bra3105_06850 [Brachybacterium halotolerans subsp. kimchii]|uniref:hypothetical protein n=1 Tax=Brachybacterium halotolerans TaxID=2795215 RepID=UPI001E2B6C41|nr:hypothetical protein [Brachybacterium halotolerans]UEJ84025.1 hypothetical protein Bra3105_06850 [Brachybacterium halotolerans subsp. kimchii]